MFPERIETNRLQLERISHATVDGFALHEFYSDDEAKEMFEHWGSSLQETVKETYDYVDEAEGRWAEADGAKYVIRPNERGRQRRRHHRDDRTVPGLGETVCQPRYPPQETILGPRIFRRTGRCHPRCRVRPP